MFELMTDPRLIETPYSLKPKIRRNFLGRPTEIFSFNSKLLLKPAIPKEEKAALIAEGQALAAEVKGAEAIARAEEVERELASLSIRLHATLVRAGLHRAK